MPRYTIGLIVIFAACFGVQSLALRLSGGKTVKSESNYFSSIARIQTETQGTPEVLMLGSSMTGRLGDRAKHIDGIGNLGCDGGSAVVTLRAMDRGIIPTAPILVIEANTLSFELEHRGREIGEAIDSHWFKIGVKTPNLGATGRPTAFAYSWLMARKAGDIPEASPLPLTSKPAVLTTAAPELDTVSTALVDEVSAIFKRLSEKGSRIYLVVLPPAAPPDSLQTKIPLAIALRSGVPFWDLNDGLPPGTVGFSDGLHLDAPSAQRVMLTLNQAIR